MRRAAASTTLMSGLPMSPTNAAPPIPSRMAVEGFILQSRTTRMRRQQTMWPLTRSS